MWFKITLWAAALATSIAWWAAINAWSEAPKKEPTTITAAVWTQVEKVVTWKTEREKKEEVKEAQNMMLLSKVPGIKKVANVWYQNEIDSDVQKVILDSVLQWLLKSPTEENVHFLVQNTTNYFIKQVITELNKQDWVKHKEAFDKIASFIAPLVVRKNEVISLDKSGKIGGYISEIEWPFSQSVMEAYDITMGQFAEKEAKETNVLTTWWKIEARLWESFFHQETIILSTIVNLATTKGELSSDIVKKVENIHYLLRSSSAKQLGQIFFELDQVINSQASSAKIENLIKLATWIVEEVAKEKWAKYVEIQRIIANQQIDKKWFFYEAVALKKWFDALKAKLLEKAKEARLWQ